eukprot:CAMPEP_0179991250 /NCGR_PEP_ID=MMETSP0984-20121128/4885_1 /TAXON_ID=483367 /ORGANISM="non described non described, Strain CCMP 2436" /LENGTH=157 /DNA_ID=CAMNT_0021910529 /DNA_START=190 /DNA_END=664 /DNA_ORIENTATION=-
MRPPREQQLIAYDCLKVLKDARITVMLPKRRTPDNSIECPKFRGQDLHKVSRTSLPLPDLTFTSPPYPAVSHDRHDVAGIRLVFDAHEEIGIPRQEVEERAEESEEEEEAPPVRSLGSALDQRAAARAASMVAQAPTPPAVLAKVSVQATETKLESA